MHKTLTLMIALIYPVYGQATSAVQSEATDDAFRLGLQQFKNKQYSAARDSFLRAESNHSQNVSLTYNLGVVYYKLENYDSARVYFTKLLNNEKYQALSFYNLALIDLKNNDKANALRWLESCINSSNNAALTQLAKHLKQKTVSDNQTSPLPVNREIKLGKLLNREPIQTRIKTYVGYNDNVTQYLAYSRQSVADNFYNVQIESVISKLNRFSIQTYAYMNMYKNEKQYNTSEFSVSGNYDNQLQSWHYELGTSLDQQFFNSETFQRIYQTNASIFRQLGSAISVTSGYQFQLIRIDNRAFEHLSGYNNQWQQNLTVLHKKLSLSLDYIYEINTRNDFYTRDNVLAASFSPKAHRIELNINYTDNNLMLDLFGKTDYSIYPDRNIINVDTFYPRRVQHKTMLIHYGTRVSYKLNKNIYLLAKYYYERNYSNIAQYRFIKNVYQTGISWQF